MRYELFYLIGASKENEVPRIKEDVMKIVKELGGVFEEKETQEKRRLAYDIKHEGHGIYIAQRFELENQENIRELTAKLNLYQDIFRFIVSKTSELPELKTKEEREAESKKAAKPEIKREPAKTEPKSPAPEKKKPEETPIGTKDPEAEASIASKNEDIDKKLEEILNI